jgi:hypothetical protein
MNLVEGAIPKQECINKRQDWKIKENEDKQISSKKGISIEAAQGYTLVLKESSKTMLRNIMILIRALLNKGVFTKDELRWSTNE